MVLEDKAVMSCDVMPAFYLCVHVSGKFEADELELMEEPDFEESEVS